MMQDISSGIKDIISEIGSKIGEFKENHQALVKLETSAAAENDYTKGQTHEINADKHKGKHEKELKELVLHKNLLNLKQVLKKPAALVMSIAAVLIVCHRLTY